jgi:selenocysteine lyase/cysteine desulfurase
MEDFRKEFPALAGCTYLNTASSGLLSKTLEAWRREEDRSFVNEGSRFRDTHGQKLEHVKQVIARFFDVYMNEIALIPNFSFGFNSLLEGMPKGKKVLLLDKDYPSVNWAVTQRDFEVCYAEVNEHLEQNIEQAVAEHQPDIFAFSLVQFQSGIQIDMNFLKQLKAYHPRLLLIADGTQYLGMESFSFSESPLDVLGASCYKWLLAGYGNGVLFVKEETQQQLLPKTIGFNSAEAVFSRRDEIPFMKHFEPGHQDTLAYGSIAQALLYMEETGMDVISEKNASMACMAKEQFAERGLLENEILKRETHSTIFNIRGDQALFQKLTNENIICSQRGNGIRVSFHFYNSPEDLATLLSVI